MCEKLLEQYEKENKYDELIKLIDEIILKDPKKASKLLFRKANALIEIKKYSQAITTLKAYLKSCSEKEKIRSYIY